MGEVSGYAVVLVFLFLQPWGIRAGKGVCLYHPAPASGARQARKCFLLLPLCPVYGLAMTAVLRLAGGEESFWRLALYGGILCTAVEYAVHFLYEKCLGVLFWDYSGTHLDLNRRICFPFSVAWGGLSALAVRYVQPKLAPVAAAIAPEVTLAALLLLTADSFFAVRLLRRSHNIDLLGLKNLWRELHRA